MCICMSYSRWIGGFEDYRSMLLHTALVEKRVEQLTMNFRNVTDELKNKLQHLRENPSEETAQNVLDMEEFNNSVTNILKLTSTQSELTISYQGCVCNGFPNIFQMKMWIIRGSSHYTFTANYNQSLTLRAPVPDQSGIFQSFKKKHAQTSPGSHMVVF